EGALDLAAEGGGDRVEDGGLGGAALGDDDELVGDGAGAREGDDAARRDPGDACRLALDRVGVVAAAVDDDDVADAAGDMEPAAGEVAAVAGAPAGRVVADGGAARDDLADLALAERLAVGVDDLDDVTAERPAAGDELERAPGQVL